MANIVIKPASGTLEFNTGVAAGSAVDTTLSGASRLTFDNGELNLASYATGNLNRFTIDGSSSRLFSAYDQMSGSLMSINTIAGFPVFEVFSDNTVVLGKYGSKDFVSTGNKIGIGTAAPANKLEVFGTGDVSVRITTTGSSAATDFAALRFFQGGSQKGSVIANSGVLRIGAGDGIGASSGVYINSTGSVGIGITSPAAKLDIVHDSGAFTPAIYVKGGVGGTSIGKFERIYGLGGAIAYVDINASAGQAQLSIASATNTFAIGTNGNNAFEIADNTTIGTNTRFLIDVNGNVGIGTTTPQALLHVTGTAANAFTIERTTANSNINMQFKNATASWYAGQTDANTFGIGTTVALGSSSIFNITTGGNVGIGTLSPVTLLTVGSTGTTTSAMTLQGEYQSSVFNNTNTFNFRHGGGDRWRLATNQNSAASNDFDFKINSIDAAGTAHTTFVTIKGLNGNVGIGTTTPTTNLQVESTSESVISTNRNAGVADNVDIGSLRFMNLGNTNALIKAIASGSNEDAAHLAFMTSPLGGSASERLRITAAGSVGVRTAEPLANFQVGLSSALTNYQGAPVGIMLPSGPGSWLELAENTTYGTSFRISKDSNGEIIFNSNVRDIGFRADNYGTAISAAQLVLKTAGNVGIGTATPTGKLEVFGTGDVGVRITTSGNDATTDFAALRFFQGGSQKGLIISNNSVLRLSAGTNLSGIFISDSGNVGINSIPTGTSGVRFQVNGGVGSNIAALRFENCGLVASSNIGEKTFSSWLPIQINSTTVRYIPLYT